MVQHCCISDEKLMFVVETQKWIENEVKTSQNPFLVKRQKMSILVLLMWCTQFLFAFFPELIWPGVSKLPDFKSQFPRWEPQSLDLILPRTLSDQGKDLFKVSITWTNILQNVKPYEDFWFQKRLFTYNNHKERNVLQNFLNISQNFSSSTSYLLIDQLWKILKFICKIIKVWQKACKLLRYSLGEILKEIFC